MPRKQAELTPEEEKELANLEEEANKEAAEVEQSSVPESATAEPKAPSEEEESEPEAPEKGQEELSDEDVALLSAKAQKRFHKLSQKAKEADRLKKELEGLKKETPKPDESPLRREFKEHTVPKETPPLEEGRLPWEASSEEREVTPEEYARDVTSAARLVVQEELSRERRLMQLSEDIKTAEGNYPELNPESDSYDEDLTNSISDWYGKLSKTDSNLRLLPFVEKLMGLRSRGAEQEKSKVTAKVAKQAAEQAISSTGAPSKAGGLEETIKSAKSIEELEETEKLLPHA